MAENRIRSILIVGGGVTGWIAAATLARRVRPDFCSVRLLDLPPERPDPPALLALPSFQRLMALLGIDEVELLRATAGTFSLGTEFQDWHQPGADYFHGFGSIGAKLEAVAFHHHWSRLREQGDATALEEYSSAAVAARAGRFARPAADPRSVLSLYSYGYHLESTALVGVLRRCAESRGVVGTTGEVRGVLRRAADGSIESLQLGDGTRVTADFFIDCAGALDPAGRWLDWSQWLPCDRAVAVECLPTPPVPPCATVRAAGFGWQWRLPLQHSLNAGYAYSSGHCDAALALEALDSSLAGNPRGEPSCLAFRPGRPESFWNGNCVTVPANALAPLEATALHLAQTAIARFLSLFPASPRNCPDAAEYNRLTALEHDRIRDLMILHYVATARDDSPFWRDCRATALPETLRAKLELYTQSGRIALLEGEHFSEDSWLAVLVGQRVGAAGYDPLADVLDAGDTRAALLRMRSAIREAVATLPTHAEFIRTSGAAGEPRPRP